jgi:hypothetical protein
LQWKNLALIEIGNKNGTNDAALYMFVATNQLRSGKRMIAMSVADRLILELSGVGVAEVATMLRRTRQAVSRGINNARKNYFKEADLEQICDETRRRNPSNINQIREIIESNFKIDSKLIRTSSGNMEISAAQNIAKQATICLHNLEQLQNDLPISFDRVSDLIRKVNLELEFVCTDKACCKAVASYIARQFNDECTRQQRLARVTYKKSDIVRYLPIMIFFDRLTNPRAFVTTFRDFAPLSEFQARRLANNLESLELTASEPLPTERY